VGQVQPPSRHLSALEGLADGPPVLADEDAAGVRVRRCESCSPAVAAARQQVYQKYVKDDHANQLHGTMTA